jgi:hypothetical protein
MVGKHLAAGDAVCFGAVSEDGQPSVRNRMDLPFYKAGKSEPSLWSAADRNREVALLRAFANPTIERGESDAVILADGNLKIIIGNTAATSPGAGSGAQMYHLKSVQADYVTARSWDGMTEGATDVYIAKEPWARSSWTGWTIMGVAHIYGYTATPMDSLNVVRSDYDGASSEDQIIVPPWCADEIIFAIPAVTDIMTVGGISVLVALLLVGRTAVWARKDGVPATSVTI